MINSLKESFYQRVLYDLSSFYLLLIYLQAAQRFDKNEIIFVVLYPTLFYDYFIVRILKRMLVISETNIRLLNR